MATPSPATRSMGTSLVESPKATVSSGETPRRSQSQRRAVPLVASARVTSTLQGSDDERQSAGRASTASQMAWASAALWKKRLRRIYGASDPYAV